jgi:hypothetical protein
MFFPEVFQNNFTRKSNEYVLLTLKPSMEKFLLGSTNTEIQYQQRHILLHTRMLQECCYIQMESLQCKTIIHLMMQEILKHEKNLTGSFNFTFRYINDVYKQFQTWWLFWSHISHWSWKKELLKTVRSDSFLDLHTESDSNDWLRKQLYDKRDEL